MAVFWNGGVLTPYSTKEEIYQDADTTKWGYLAASLLLVLLLIAALYQQDVTLLLGVATSILMAMFLYLTKYTAGY